ncbi:FliA/WhiG family RNA polymerase sigma factor [Ornithinibacillus sp. L9]|uniref:FliA/WhiG family RNA polymerase sigma factor n=1 Tax=Ornithinibacillus caprae TaxID=2678566 RepID=A0A6N8FJT4_9BACI|nr:FliA/WhiG family RNA polymerase sigma factor [Ornithinibacillus caprae]MUK89890.1 FliA/WhiG family RNA polymerase sigma factor [Ornithinibacillus caprae]
MKKTRSPLEQGLWNKWLEEKDNEAANELIKNYMYLVNFHVDRTASHLPSSVQKDDLKSLGLMGLYDALKKFEIDRDLKFETYASFRIRGAIMDGLRKEDWLPRSIRDKAKKVDQISQQLEQSNQREPTLQEIATAAELPVKEVETLIRDSLFANVLSIEEKPKDGSFDHKEGIGYSIPDRSASSPDENIVKSELNKDLAMGIKSLNENEQMIISLFYNEELTFTEIGHVLGLTTSRISQIHKKAVVKLRGILEKI